MLEHIIFFLISSQLVLLMKILNTLLVVQMDQILEEKKERDRLQKNKEL